MSATSRLGVTVRAHVHASEHKSEAEFNEHGYCTHNGDPACWNITWQNADGSDRKLSADEWCEPCRQRQAAHEAYTKAVARRQGLMRGLQRRALTAWEALQSADEVAIR